MWSGKIFVAALSLGVVSACHSLTVYEQEQMLEPRTTKVSELVFRERQKVARSFTAYFASDSSKIDAEASSVISSAVIAAQEDEVVEVSLSGHTDRAGSAKYNTILSKYRVDAVAAVFIEAGISPGIIKKSIHGEEQPRTPTLDDQPEPSNRRVDIEVVKLAETLKEPEPVRESKARQDRCSYVIVYIGGALLTPCVIPLKKGVFLSE